MPEPIQRVKIATAEVKGESNWPKITDDHRSIMATLENAARSRLCASVATIAQQTGIAEDEVRNHLTLMTIDKGGTFMDQENHTFCVQPGLILALDKLRSLTK